MTISNRAQAVLAGVSTEFAGNGYTHETVEVTVTATMKNGSFLKADATEAAVADVAVVDSILDDPRFPVYGATEPMDFFAVGDVVMVRVAKRSVIANSDVVCFSDAAFGGQALALLDARGVLFQSAKAEFEYE